MKEKNDFSNQSIVVAAYGGFVTGACTGITGEKSPF
jgi:hypothetical protein